MNPLYLLLQRMLFLFFLLLPLWVVPYLPVVVLMVILLLMTVYLFVKERGKVVRIWKSSLILKVWLALYLYWVLNLVFVGHVLSAETLTSLDFWENDGKVFFSYLPVGFVLLAPFISLKEKKFLVKVVAVVALFLSGLGILQFISSAQLGFLGPRQQLVLLGNPISQGLTKKLFVGGHLTHNAAAAFYLFPLFYFLVQYLNRRGVIRLSALVVVGLAFLLTFSRSGLLGFAVGLGTLVILVWAGKQYTFRKGDLFKFVLGLVFVVLVFGFLVQVLLPRWTLKIEQMVTLSGGNISSRFRLWEKALSLASVSPLYGVGLTRFNDVGYTIQRNALGLPYSAGGKVISSEAHAHNFYLHALAETGSWGLFLYLGFWFVIFYYLIKSYKKSQSFIGLHGVLFASLAGLLVTGFFENTLASPSVMFLYLSVVGLVLGTPEQEWRDQKAQGNGVCRVLFLSTHSQMGGAQRVLLDYLENTKLLELDKEGYLISLEDGPLVERAKSLGCKVYVVRGAGTYLDVSRKKVGWLGLAKGFFPLISTTLKVYWYVESEGIDLIFSNGVKTHLIGGFVSLLSGRKLVVRFHDVITSSEFNRKTRWITAMGLKLFSEEVLVVSEAVRDSLLMVGVSKKKIRVVYNGFKLPARVVSLDLSCFGVKDAYPVLAVIARLTKGKGQEVAIRALPIILRKYPRARLILAGDAYFEYENYDKYLRDLVKKLKLEKNVVFTGFVENVYGLIRAVDLVIHPSTAPDALPTAVLESVALGTYTVASRIGGVPEIIKDKRWGLLCEPGNSRDLAEKVLQALNDGRPGKKKYNKDFIGMFSMERYVLQIDEVLKKYSGQKKL